jgi:hypothetical protein
MLTWQSKRYKDKVSVDNGDLTTADKTLTRMAGISPDFFAVAEVLIKQPCNVLNNTHIRVQKDVEYDDQNNVKNPYHCLLRLDICLQGLDQNTYQKMRLKIEYWLMEITKQHKKVVTANGSIPIY